MSNNSISRRSGGKAKRPKLPRKKFPLSIHKGTGYWCKKVRGRVHYFGKVADDPKGVAAEEEWARVKDDLLAGREPGAKSDALTVADLCNQFLAHKEQLRDNGELNSRTFRGHYDTCATADQVAVDAVMGHVPQGMAGLYRERIGDDRLRRVVEHVRTWLFGN